MSADSSFAWTSRNLGIVISLGTAQTIAWASSYYLPAILAESIGRDLNVAPTYIFGALSGALIIAGILGPRVGHTIDTLGGRGVLSISSVLLAAGLTTLSFASNLITLCVAWLLLGVGMGLGLYEAAFATLTRIYGTLARKPITGITLIAGFASTVGWPLSAYLDAQFGWRTACLVWAAIHLFVGLPLNLLLPKAAPLSPPPEKSLQPASAQRSERFAMVAIAYVFAATGFVSSGFSALLPTMLVQFGATTGAALFAGMLVGPAQVAARILEAGWLGRYHPLASTRLATLMNPLGVIILIVGGPVVAPLFAVLYGMGNGILTIARGTLPLAIFGPAGFGRRVGVLSVPARVTGAVAPLAVGLLVQNYGAAALWMSAAASLSAFVVLLCLSGQSREEAAEGART